MRVYNFLTCENALDDISKRLVKISSLADLNDPFELMSVELPDREMRKAFKATKDYLNRHFGVICFSKRWSNPVLWAHYADKHRGICLGFDVPDSLIEEISYSGRRLPLVLLF